MGMGGRGSKPVSFKCRPAVPVILAVVCVSGCAHRAATPRAETAAPAGAAHHSKFSANSTMAVLLDTPETRAVLMRHVPGVVKSPQISLARGLSLKQLAGFSKAGISPQTLSAIDADLAKIN